MKDITLHLGPDDTVVAFIPSLVTEGGHSVQIPLNVDGVKALRNILQSRKREARATIGTSASPTQQQINAFLASMRKDQEQRVSKKIEEIAPGLDLSDINI